MPLFVWLNNSHRIFFATKLSTKSSIRIVFCTIQWYVEQIKPQDAFLCQQLCGWMTSIVFSCQGKCPQNHHPSQDTISHRKFFKKKGKVNINMAKTKFRTKKRQRADTPKTSSEIGIDFPQFIQFLATKTGTEKDKFLQDQILYLLNGCNCSSQQSKNILSRCIELISMENVQQFNGQNDLMDNSVTIDGLVNSIENDNGILGEGQVEVASLEANTSDITTVEVISKKKITSRIFHFDENAFYSHQLQPEGVCCWNTAKTNRYRSKTKLSKILDTIGSMEQQAVCIRDVCTSYPREGIGIALGLLENPGEKSMVAEQVYASIMELMHSKKCFASHTNNSISFQMNAMVLLSPTAPPNDCDIAI